MIEKATGESGAHQSRFGSASRIGSFFPIVVPTGAKPALSSRPERRGGRVRSLVGPGRGHGYFPSIQRRICHFELAEKSPRRSESLPETVPPAQHSMSVEDGLRAIAGPQGPLSVRRAGRSVPTLRPRGSGKEKTPAVWGRRLSFERLIIAGPSARPCVLPVSPDDRDRRLRHRSAPN